MSRIREGQTFQKNSLIYLHELCIMVKIAANQKVKQQNELHQSARQPVD